MERERAFFQDLIDNSKESIMKELKPMAVGIMSKRREEGAG